MIGKTVVQPVENISMTSLHYISVVIRFDTAMLRGWPIGHFQSEGQSSQSFYASAPSLWDKTDSCSQTPICYALHSFVLHLAPTVSVLLLLKFGTLSLRLFECVPAMIPSAINSRPTTSSRPSNPLSAFFLAPQIRLWLTIVRVYKLYWLTYLLTLITF